MGDEVKSSVVVGTNGWGGEASNPDEVCEASRGMSDERPTKRLTSAQRRIVIAGLPDDARHVRTVYRLRNYVNMVAELSLKIGSHPLTGKRPGDRPWHAPTAVKNTSFFGGPDGRCMLVTVDWHVQTGYARWAEASFLQFGVNGTLSSRTILECACSPALGYDEAVSELTLESDIEGSFGAGSEYDIKVWTGARP